MRFSVVFAALAVALAPAARGQELNCAVSVNRAQVGGAEYTFLDDLQQEVARYLNARAWTDDVFDARERIECSVQIQVVEALSLTQFRAQLAVQTTRPIYGTAQRSTTLLLRDNAWLFDYTRGQALVFDPNRYDSLTSVLDFYALVMLGVDYDTFAELGGTRHFERARLVAELGRGDLRSVGWGRDPTEDRSRYTLIQEMLDPVFDPVRRAHFTYHFTVLDRFLLDQNAAWAAALVTFQELDALYQELNQRRYVTDLFFGARHQEIALLMREAPQRNEAYALLSNMDPSHLSTYDALVGGR